MVEWFAADPEISGSNLVLANSCCCFWLSEFKSSAKLVNNQVVCLMPEVYLQYLFHIGPEKPLPESGQIFN